MKYYVSSVAFASHVSKTPALHHYLKLCNTLIEFIILAFTVLKTKNTTKKEKTIQIFHIYHLSIMIATKLLLFSSKAIKWK